MSIDRSGKWWRGANFDDVVEYLHEFTADGYPLGQVREAACASCQGKIFGLRGDADEGVVRRTCRQCSAKAFIADSDEGWSDATIRTCKCPCGGLDYNVGVGFAFRDSGDVQWVTVAQRCVACGVLGSFADWRVNYAPSAHLVDRA